MNEFVLSNIVHNDFKLLNLRLIATSDLRKLLILHHRRRARLIMLQPINLGSSSLILLFFRLYGCLKLLVQIIKECEHFYGDVAYDKEELGVLDFEERFVVG